MVEISKGISSKSPWKKSVSYSIILEGTDLTGNMQRKHGN